MALPRYKSHKVVSAAKVADYLLDYEGVTHRLLLDTGDVVDWPKGMVRDNPIGGYYVVYEDGHTSWSPADVFEKGYTLVEDKPLLSAQKIADFVRDGEFTKHALIARFRIGAPVILSTPGKPDLEAMVQGIGFTDSKVLYLTQYGWSYSDDVRAAS